jgi:hypothetical protein
MSIQVVCRNGHALKVKSEFAGKQGLCPVCKVPIEVPSLAATKLSEDAIINILESHSPAPPRPAAAVVSARRPVATVAAAVPAPSPPVAAPSPPSQQGSPFRKVCHKCKQEVVAGIHICPHCHAYVANLRDF